MGVNQRSVFRVAGLVTTNHDQDNVSRSKRSFDKWPAVVERCSLNTSVFSHLPDFVQILRGSARDSWPGEAKMVTLCPNG